MTVSVAMTTYNGASYVEKQLNSLLHQTRKIDETIIIDDCSKDNTAEIIKQFIDVNQLSNWHFFENKQNIGYIQNFYNAIEKTNGKVIFLCDQDDIWDKEKVEKMCQVLDENPQISVLNSAVKLIDRNDKTIELKAEKGFSNANMFRKNVPENAIISVDFKHLSLRNISPGCSMCFCAETKNILLKNRQNLIPHDWFINILGSLQNSTFFYNKELTNYRMHNQNAIGLKIEKPLIVETNRDSKLKTAKKYYERTLYLKKIIKQNSSNENYIFISKYSKLLLIRLLFFEKLSCKMYLQMLKYWKTYRFAFGYRIIISDFIYLLKMDKYLRL